MQNQKSTSENSKKNLQFQVSKVEKFNIFPSISKIFSKKNLLSGRPKHRRYHRRCFLETRFERVRIKRLDLEDWLIEHQAKVRQNSISLDLVEHYLVKWQQVQTQIYLALTWEGEGNWSAIWYSGRTIPVPETTTLVRKGGEEGDKLTGLNYN